MHHRNRPAGSAAGAPVDGKRVSSNVHHVTEQWRPVLGWEGLYEVSDLGRVRSVDRSVVSATGRTWIRKGRLLALTQHRSGYRLVTLRRPGAGSKRWLHQLVTEAFHGPRPYPGAEVRHGEGGRSDNRASNLRWGTRSDNMFDSVRDGTHHYARRERCNRGHRLVPPNLRSSSTERNRKCLACHRGHTECSHLRRRHGRQADLQQVADRHYGEIMGDLPR